MKNMYTTITNKITLLLCLLTLAFTQTKAQTNSYLGLDGGFEGAATIDNTATGDLLPRANKWVKANANITIANETSTVRSGNNSLKVSSSSSSTSRVWSPLVTLSATTTKWVVQYYRRATSLTATIQNQSYVYRGTVETGNGTYTTIPAINTWEKVTYAPTSVLSVTQGAAGILGKMKTTAGDMYFDDFVLYESSTGVDNAAPNDPTAAATASATTSSLDVSWTAASGGVDGGGYIVVRGIADPTTAPNVNGIYAVGNTIAAGETVVYNGTGTSFTDGSLASGTQYFYRVYTYDKAYNYSSSSNCNGTTLSGGSPTLSGSALTAFGSQCVGSTYGPNMFTISGSTLTSANVTVAALSGFTYSTTLGGTYTSTLSLTQPGGAYSQDIYVKFTPASAIVYSGNIVVGGGGASNINVAASGTGINGTVAVTTVAASSILTTSASSGGNTVSTTCGTITDKGVVWGAAANPTVPSVNSTNDGAGTSDYTSTMGSLTAGTTYNYRAYATNSNGVTSYGTNLTFVTLKLEPTNYPTAFSCGTTTTSTIPLTWTAATGAVLPDGYLVKWSATSYAAITAPSDGSPESNGATTQNVVGASYTATGLTTGTTYFFKIWSYTNSGSSIDYKLTSEPQTSCATITGPCQSDNFNSSYGNWTGGSGSYNNNTAGLTGNGVGFNSTNDDIITATTIAGASSITFMASASSAGANYTMKVQYSTANTGPWTDVATLSANGSNTGSVNDTWNSYNYAITPSATYYLRFFMSARTGGSFYLDDVDVFCTPLCVSPITTASVTASNITPSGLDLAWTGAAGDGTMLVIRATANADLAPTSGTSYTPNTNFATAGQINTNNRVVFRAAGSSVTGITGLSAETQYTATAYNYNSLDDCYQLASPASTNFYTLSTEPSAHAASFTSSAVAYNQINLTFSAASTITNADGYIILQRTAAAPTGLPSDANGYLVGNSIGDATVAAIINSTATTTASITGLSGSTQYYFTLIPFNWNGSIAATYNYRTAATIPLTNATTLIQPSTSSDIIANATYTYNSNINYLTHQATPITNTGNSIDLFKFDIRDGGAGADADALPTILSDITFNVSNLANIRTAALFNVNTPVNTAPTINYLAGTISFSGLSGANVTALDGGTNSLTLRVTWLSTVTDNAQIQVTIAAANTTAASGSTSSLFGAFTNVVSSTTSDRNRLEVTADRIAFVQQPTETGVSATMSPAVTVAGVDVNGNTDFDYTGSIDITSTGTLTGSPVTVSAVAGIATYSGLIHTVAQTGRVLTATTTGLASSNTVNSANFDITTVPANSYRTITAGTWTSGGGTATWERLIAGTWTANTAPVFNSANNIYIRHFISITGSTSAASIIVENGGKLTNAASCTYGGTLCRVENGGILQVNASVTIGGDFIVLDGGTVNINFSFGNPVTSIWSGTENFYPASNLVIQNWDFSTPDFLIPDNTSISTNTYNGYTAAFGNVIIDAGSNSTAWNMLAPGTNINLAHGNLEFLTNAANINLATTGTVTTGIGGDFYVDDLYTATNVIQFKTSGTMTFTIKGNFQQDAATVRVLAGSVAGSASVLNVEGDMTITSSAVLDFNSTVAGGPPPPLATINLKGDLTGVGSGLLQNSNTSSLGVFNFTGTGDGLTAATTQTIDIASTGGNENKNINFNINSGAYVRLINRDFELGNASGVYVKDGGVFDFGFAGTTPLNVTISGAQTATVFQSFQGSTLKITSVDGISTTGAIGNVRTVASNRTFSQAATFHYIGKAEQVTGNAITTGSTGKIVICELDLNTLTLTPSNNIAMSNTATLDVLGGRLEIRKGIVVVTPSATITGSGRLVMTDGTYRTSILATTIPQLSNYSNYSLTGGTVELNGNGAQTLSGAPNGGYYNLAVTNAGTKSVTSGFSIANNLLITAGIFDPTNNGIIGNAGITMTGGRFRMSILNQTLPQLTGIATPYALSGGTIELYGTTNTQTQSLRGTYGTGPSTVSYFNVDLNSTGANVAAASANVVAGAGFGVAGVMTVFSPTCFQLGSGFIINDAGTSTFDLQAGATLKYGGSIAASGASGNIRTDVRNFPTTASYGFTGAVTPQAVGTGLPASMVNMYLDKFDGTSTVVLAQNSNVTGTLDLGLGKLDLNNFNVTMGTTSVNGTITNASANSYVITWDGAANGNIVHNVNSNAAYWFPVGDLTDYTPATVTMTGGTRTLATLTGRVTDGVHPNIGTSSNYLSRYWSIVPSGIVNPFYNIVYSYATGGGGEEVGSPSNMWPFKHNTNGWIGCTGSGSAFMMGNGNFNPGTRTFTWNNLYSFSDFTGNGNGSPLPISLLNFDAQLVNSVVHLTWATATEVNNDYFTIEHAANNGDFVALENIAGAGNSNEILHYATKDFNPQNGQNYYRLKQTDFDGKYSYSAIRSIAININTVAKPFTVYHNSNNQTADINLYANDNDIVSISLYDLSGQLVYSEMKAAAKGNNAWHVSTSSFSAGIYFIKVNIGDTVNTAKFIKP